MIEISYAQFIVCQLCNAEVRRTAKQIVGCHCDPDSATWCGIQPDGRLLAWSLANYEIVSTKPSEHNYD